MNDLTDGYVPMPMTCHPFYESQAASIRGGLHMPVLRVANTRPLTASYAAEGWEYPISEAATEVLTLDIKKVAGPAPFVGDPIYQRGIYEWRAAVDKVGRHVAGEATLIVEERIIPLNMPGAPL